MFDVPVLLIVYKRIDTLLQILERIQQINPIRLYIASDAPNKKNTDDWVKNNLVRSLIKDYPFNTPQVFTNFQTENLGCGKGPKAAIDWFFEHETQGIILEDDCLPDISFFLYCKEMLSRYAENESVMSISGNNYLLDEIQIQESHYFTKYPNIWGWATWRRAWARMDWEMKNYLEFLQKDTLHTYTNSDSEYQFWKKIFDHVYNTLHHSSCWDYQWLFSIWNNNGFGIAPNINLVQNIGFDDDATHTSKKPLWYNKVINGSWKNTNSPTKILIHQEADNFLFTNTIHPPTVPPSLFRKIQNRLSAYKRRIFPEKQQWQDHEYFDPIWQLRIKQMSAYVQPADTVVDLGCGMMWLKGFLSATNTYIPVDYKRRGEDTIVCDFNNAEFPDKHADIYFVSGCLEYVEDVDWFLKKIADHTDKCVISYCTTAIFPDISVRNGLMWKNHLSEDQLISLFQQNGFSLKDKRMTDLNNQIYYFTK